MADRCLNAPCLPPFAGPRGPCSPSEVAQRMEGSVMKGRRANLGRVLWSALQHGEVQSFILVFFFSCSPYLLPSLAPACPLFPLSFLLSGRISLTSPSPPSLCEKRDEKPFDSQFLSRIFHSDTRLRGREESGCGRRAGVGFRRDQSNPVFHVGGSECFC